MSTPPPCRVAPHRPSTNFSLAKSILSKTGRRTSVRRTVRRCHSQPNGWRRTPSIFSSVSRIRRRTERPFYGPAYFIATGRRPQLTSPRPCRAAMSAMHNANGRQPVSRRHQFHQQHVGVLIGHAWQQHALVHLHMFAVITSRNFPALVCLTVCQLTR